MDVESHSNDISEPWRGKEFQMCLECPSQTACMNAGVCIGDAESELEDCDD